MRLARIPSRASARRSQVRFFAEHLRGQFPHGAETLERTDGPCGPLLGVGTGEEENMLKHVFLFSVAGWALSALVRDLSLPVFVVGVFYLFYALYRTVLDD